MRYTTFCSNRSYNMNRRKQPLSSKQSFVLTVSPGAVLFLVGIYSVRTWSFFVNASSLLHNFAPSQETLRHGLGVLPSNPRPRSGSPPAPSFLTAPSSVCVRGDSVEIKELRSNDGRFRFVMQPEQRNLALYMEDDAVWAIYLTSPHPAPATSEEGDDSHDRLVLLSDGNLVAMDCSLRHVWSSNTANAAPGPYTLTLQDDGDCVLFAGGGVRLWATGTAGWG